MTKKKKRTPRKWSRNQKILFWGTIILPAVIILGGVWKHFAAKPKASQAELDDLKERIRQLEKDIIALVPPAKTTEDAERFLRPDEKAEYKRLVAQLKEEQHKAQRRFKQEIKISIETQLSYVSFLVRQAKYTEAEQD